VGQCELSAVLDTHAILPLVYFGESLVQGLARKQASPSIRLLPVGPKMRAQLRGTSLLCHQGPEPERAFEVTMLAMSVRELPPALLARATGFRLRGRVHFPKECIGDVHPGRDEEFVVVRKMTLDPTRTQPEMPGALFTVKFRFRRFGPAVNKRLSLIPAPFIAAQPGFRSKTWMLGRESGMFQGVYEWDTVPDAEAYWTSFPMRLMKRRAVPGSVVHEIEPV